MSRLIGKILQRIANIGVFGEVGADTRHVTVVNIAGVLALSYNLIYNAFYLFFDAELFLPILIVNTVMMSGYLISIWINHTRRHRMAANLVFTTALLQVAMDALLMGRDSGISLILIAIGVVALIGYAKNDIRPKILVGVTSTALLLICNTLFADPLIKGYAPWIADTLFILSTLAIVGLILMTFAIYTQRLDETSSKLEIALKHMPGGILLVDRYRTIGVSNNKFAELFDVPKEMVTPGKTITEFIKFIVDRGDFERFASSQDTPLKSPFELVEKEQTIEVTMEDHRTLEIHLGPTPVGGGIAIVTDISDRKRQEKELLSAQMEAESANRSKSEFLANMSHELRTPLNAVIGFSQIMTSQYIGPMENEKYLEYSDDILGSGLHLLNIVNDILDLSKVEAGAMELMPETVELSRTINDSLQFVRQRALSDGVGLEFIHADKAIYLNLDRQKIQQVLLNLLTNAIKFSQSGMKISVSVLQLPDGRTGFKVSDQGSGIAAEDLKLVLQPFGQTAIGKHEKNEGTGLGLPLSVAYVELHGGILSIDSTLGRGTDINVLFPIELIDLKNNTAENS